MIATLLKMVPDWLKMVGSGVLGALVVAGPVFLYGVNNGETKAEARAAREAIDRIQEMEKNDANFKNKSARDRCLVLMRDSRLPAENCD